MLWSSGNGIASVELRRSRRDTSRSRERSRSQPPEEASDAAPRTLAEEEEEDDGEGSGLSEDGSRPSTPGRSKTAPVSSTLFMRELAEVTAEEFRRLLRYDVNRLICSSHGYQGDAVDRATLSIEQALNAVLEKLDSYVDYAVQKVETLIGSGKPEQPDPQKLDDAVMQKQLRGALSHVQELHKRLDQSKKAEANLRSQFNRMRRQYWKEIDLWRERCQRLRLRCSSGDDGEEAEDEQEETAELSAAADQQEQIDDVSYWSSTEFLSPEVLKLIERKEQDMNERQEVMQHMMNKQLEKLKHDLSKARREKTQLETEFLSFRAEREAEAACSGGHAEDVHVDDSAPMGAAESAPRPLVGEIAVSQIPSLSGALPPSSWLTTAGEISKQCKLRMEACANDATLSKGDLYAAITKEFNVLQDHITRGRRQESINAASAADDSKDSDVASKLKQAEEKQRALESKLLAVSRERDTVKASLRAEKDETAKQRRLTEKLKNDCEQAKRTVSAEMERNGALTSEVQTLRAALDASDHQLAHMEAPAAGTHRQLERFSMINKEPAMGILFHGAAGAAPEAVRASFRTDAAVGEDAAVETDSEPEPERRIDPLFPETAADLAEDADGRATANGAASVERPADSAEHALEPAEEGSFEEAVQQEDQAGPEEADHKTPEERREPEDEEESEESASRDSSLSDEGEECSEGEEPSGFNGRPRGKRATQFGTMLQGQLLDFERTQLLDLAARSEGVRWRAVMPRVRSLSPGNRRPRPKYPLRDGVLVPWRLEDALTEAEEAVDFQKLSALFSNSATGRFVTSDKPPSFPELEAAHWNLHRTTNQVRSWCGKLLEDQRVVFVHADACKFEVDRLRELYKESLVRGRLAWELQRQCILQCQHAMSVVGNIASFDIDAAFLNEVPAQALAVLSGRLQKDASASSLLRRLAHIQSVASRSASQELDEVECHALAKACSLFSLQGEVSCDLPASLGPAADPAGSGNQGAANQGLVERLQRLREKQLQALRDFVGSGRSLVTASARCAVQELERALSSERAPAAVEPVNDSAASSSCSESGGDECDSSDDESVTRARRLAVNVEVLDAIASGPILDAELPDGTLKVGRTESLEVAAPILGTPFVAAELDIPAVKRMQWPHNKRTEEREPMCVKQVEESPPTVVDALKASTEARYKKWQERMRARQAAKLASSQQVSQQPAATSSEKQLFNVFDWRPQPGQAAVPAKRVTLSLHCPPDNDNEVQSAASTAALARLRAPRASYIDQWKATRCTLLSAVPTMNDLAEETSSVCTVSNDTMALLKAATCAADREESGEGTQPVPERWLQSALGHCLIAMSDTSRTDEAKRSMLAQASKVDGALLQRLFANFADVIDGLRQKLGPDAVCLQGVGTALPEAAEPESTRIQSCASEIDQVSTDNESIVMATPVTFPPRTRTVSVIKPVVTFVDAAVQVCCVQTTVMKEHGVQTEPPVWDRDESTRRMIFGKGPALAFVSMVHKMKAAIGKDNRLSAAADRTSSATAETCATRTSVAPSETASPKKKRAKRSTRHPENKKSLQKARVKRGTTSLGLGAREVAGGSISTVKVTETTAKQSSNLDARASAFMLRHGSLSPSLASPQWEEMSQSTRFPTSMGGDSPTDTVATPDSMSGFQTPLSMEASRSEQTSPVPSHALRHASVAPVDAAAHHSIAEDASGGSLSSSILTKAKFVPNFDRWPEPPPSQESLPPVLGAMRCSPSPRPRQAILNGIRRSHTTMSSGWSRRASDDEEGDSRKPRTLLSLVQSDEETDEQQQQQQQPQTFDTTQQESSDESLSSGGSEIFVQDVESLENMQALLNVELPSNDNFVRGVSLEDMGCTEELLNMIGGCASEVVDVGLATAIPWDSIPGRVFAWLRLNLIQRQQASMYCTSWVTSELDDFPDICLSERERLLKEVESFLFGAMALVPPGRGSAHRRGLRKFYREQCLQQMLDQGNAANNSAVLRRKMNAYHSLRAMGTELRGPAPIPPLKIRSMPIYSAKVSEAQDINGTSIHEGQGESTMQGSLSDDSGEDGECKVEEQPDSPLAGSSPDAEGIQEDALAAAWQEKRPMIDALSEMLGFDVSLARSLSSAHDVGQDPLCLKFAAEELRELSLASQPMGPGADNQPGEAAIQPVCPLAALPAAPAGARLASDLAGKLRTSSMPPISSPMLAQPPVQVSGTAFALPPSRPAMRPPKRRLQTMHADDERFTSRMKGAEAMVRRLEAARLLHGKAVPLEVQEHLAALDVFSNGTKVELRRLIGNTLSQQHRFVQHVVPLTQRLKADAAAIAGGTSPQDGVDAPSTEELARCMSPGPEGSPGFIEIEAALESLIGSATRRQLTTNKLMRFGFDCLRQEVFDPVPSPELPVHLGLGPARPSMEDSEARETSLTDAGGLDAADSLSELPPKSAASSPLPAPRVRRVTDLPLYRVATPDDYIGGVSWSYGSTPMPPVPAATAVRAAGSWAQGMNPSMAPQFGSSGPIKMESEGESLDVNDAFTKEDNLPRTSAASPPPKRSQVVTPRLSRRPGEPIVCRRLVEVDAQQAGEAVDLPPVNPAGSIPATLPPGLPHARRTLSVFAGALLKQQPHGNHSVHPSSRSGNIVSPRKFPGWA